MKRITVTFALASLSACATTHPSAGARDRGDDERPRLAAAAPRPSRLRKSGYVVLGLGGLFAVGAAIAGASGDRPGCHDEQCWLGPLVAGSTLGALGGSLLIGGGIMALAGGNDR
jgi:hypothetical protein